MIQLFKYKWNRIAVQFSGMSFIIGTVYMLILLFSENDLIKTVGITLIVLYVPTTLIVLLILLANTLANFKDIHEHILALVLVFINIPIAILYSYFFY
ncbi:hypothetical protein GH721_16805 [Kriegella sp. EG-1]|nr:hypothetical protein [Flavobacteriaceae bacterium EG-1]